MIHYSKCPVCDATDIDASMRVKDHTLNSGEYSIWVCKNCTLKFTQDIPEESEIGKFYQSAAYVSHTDTKEGFIHRLYHQVRKITLRKKRKLIVRESRVQTGSLLDIGCGTGTFLFEMKKNGWMVTGLEPDPGAAEKASLLNQTSIQSPSALFTLDQNSVNVVTMWHVLEHVHRLHEYIDQIGHLLKKGGILVIAVPNHTSADAVHYQENWAAYDVPRHLYHFSPESMKQLLGKHGFEIRKIKPMWFDSFYVSMLSEQYKNGKSGHVAAFYHGLMSNLKALFSKEHRCSSQIYVAVKK